MVICKLCLEIISWLAQIARIINTLFLKWDKQAAKNIEMAFGKEKASSRKEWVGATPKEWFVDHTVKALPYSDFVNKELVHFCRYVAI